MAGAAASSPSFFPEYFVLDGETKKPVAGYFYLAYMPEGYRHYRYDTSDPEGRELAKLSAYVMSRRLETAESGKCRPCEQGRVRVY